VADVTLNAGLAWALTIIIFPLFWVLWVYFNGQIKAVREGNEAATTANGLRVDRLKEELSAYKLEVAKNYASIEYLKDVERRLTGHLVRIEKKLDETHNREIVA